MIPRPIEPGKFKVSDRVYHSREPEANGTVVHVDDPPLSVLVRWDDGEPDDPGDFQWNDKLVLSEPFRGEPARNTMKATLERLGAVVEAHQVNGKTVSTVCLREDPNVQAGGLGDTEEEAIKDCVPNFVAILRRRHAKAKRDYEKFAALADLQPSPFAVGDRVCIRGCPGELGTVTRINEPPLSVQVNWDSGDPSGPEDEFEWNYKLAVEGDPNAEFEP